MIADQLPHVRLTEPRFVPPPNPERLDCAEPGGGQHPDERLFASVIRGVPGAFGAFHTRFAGLVTACVLRAAGKAGLTLQPADRADAVADVMLALVAHDYRRLRQYRAGRGCTPASWVGLIAHSAAHDHLRRARRRRLDAVEEHELERLMPAAPAPDALYEAQETASRMTGLLRKLSPRDQEFVDLYYLQALEPEVVAERMQVSISTVYSKKAKLKARLHGAAKLARA